MFMSLNTNIPSWEHYTLEMRKSLIDKLFFLDKVNTHTLLDFGCADGTLLNAVSCLFPNYLLLGYDVSRPMIQMAEKLHPHIKFGRDWEALISYINPTKTTLILSSIIHEIYAYSNPAELKQFWKRVWETGFKTIVLRDMMVSKVVSRPSDPLAVAKVRQCHPAKQLIEWETQWGPLEDNWSLVHFLLTYRYQKNWEWEYKENYLPIPVESFLASIPTTYSPIFFDHFTLPFIRGSIYKHFKIDLNDRTHMKLIVEKC